VSSESGSPSASSAAPAAASAAASAAPAAWSTVAIVARKELRASFQSPVALIFLGLFLVSTLYSFFGHASFFARNIADVRPLFEWLPLTLILLVAAVTMRQWAEERKMGTLEVLVTLPVTTRDLVLGKFFAGLALVAVALAMTLPIPILVQILGPLDWGPVVGGYLGALLLAAAYLSVGLCISARTDNQVVALMLTLVVAGALYFLGSDRITSLFGNQGADLLRGLGTGSRFASIERGVLDLRDLVYYLGLAGFALCLNWYFLEADRLDPTSPRGRQKRRRLAALVALVAANMLLLSLWLAPVTRLRVDVTERGDYSISQVTVDALAQLAEPLRIDGYFSERTHPLLAPLVPQIRDLLREYEVYGNGRVQVGIADPNADEALESELNEEYQIRSVPFRVADRHQQAIVNSYFHILIRYGDQHASLGFDELIDVYAGDSGIQVRLRNLEYDVTKTIKRVSQEFQNMESIFARLPDSLTLTLFVTSDTLPEGFAELPPRIQNVAGELVEASRGKLEFREVDPSGDSSLAERLASDYGIQPLAVDLFGRRTFYLDLLLQSGEKAERILPRSDLSESDLRVALEAAIRRLTPGQLKTVGLLTERPASPPLNPNIPPQFQPPPRRPDYQILEQLLREEYEVTRVQLEDGLVPDVIDVLLIGKPGSLSEHQKFAIDQYLMRGGKLIVLTSSHAIRPERSSLVAQRATTPLHEMLESWGVKVDPAIVMDPQNASFPIPVSEQRGGLRLQRIRMLPYPFFPDVRGDAFADAQPAFLGITNVTTPWASPLELVPIDGLESEILMSSSEGSWLNVSGDIEPDLVRFPETGFEPVGDTASRVLGVSLTGRFPSYYAARPSPLFEGSEAEQAQDAADRTGRTMKESLPDAKLVVVGSSEMVSDLMMQLANGPGGEVHRNNLQLVQNLVDWSVESTDLLSIRSSGAFARTLRPMGEAESRGWELGVYGLTALLLLGVTLIPARRRSRAQSLALPAGLDSKSELEAPAT
jgi:ABC-2 type transport system permease protein